MHSRRCKQTEAPSVALRRSLAALVLTTIAALLSCIPAFAATLDVMPSASVETTGHTAVVGENLGVADASSRSTTRLSNARIDATAAKRGAGGSSRSSTSRIAGNGATKGAESAYDVAAAGGKHAGFLKNYVGRSPAEIDKGITSIERQIAKHEEAIANPKSKIPNWDGLDPRQQEALVNRKWPGDISRQREQLDILQRLRQGG